jgi:hypothetical protein
MPGRFTAASVTLFQTIDSTQSYAQIPLFSPAFVVAYLSVDSLSQRRSQAYKRHNSKAQKELEGG